MLKIKMFLFTRELDSIENGSNLFLKQSMELIIMNKILTKREFAI